MPRKLKEVLRQLKTRGTADLMLEESSSSESDEAEVVPTIAPRKEQKAKRQKDDTFVPMNVFDLLEQANSTRKSAWEDNQGLQVKRERLEQKQSKELSWGQGAVR